MYYCPYCKKQLNRCGIGSHLRKYIRTLSKSKNEIKKDYLIYNTKNKNLFSDIVRDYKKQYSLPDLKKIYKIDFKSIIFILNYNNIKIRTIKEVANSKIFRNKCAKTCLKKYGKTNPLSKGTKPYKKKIKTFIRKYGIENPIALKMAREKIRLTYIKK